MSGKLIRLSEVSWFEKILQDHPEFKTRSDYLQEVKKTIQEPEYLVMGWAGEYLALRYSEIAPMGPKHLCVIYREADGGGFVITTFFISKIQKLLRRGVIWRKLK